MSKKNFGDLLRLEANSTIYEEKIWNLMKEPLLKLSKMEHADGCHIEFENFSNIFLKNIKDIVESEDLKLLQMSGRNNGRILIWNYESTTGYTLSNMKLVVRKDESDDYANIIIDILKNKYKIIDLYEYVKIV